MLLLKMVVEKMLDGQGRSRRDIGREAFTQEVWKWKEQYGGFISQQMRSLGASCDWSRERFTLDAQLSGMIQQTLALTPFQGGRGGGRGGGGGLQPGPLSFLSCPALTKTLVVHRHSHIRHPVIQPQSTVIQTHSNLPG